MAEKRAKDRVTLKLLSSNGAIYSDAEADDFAQSQGGGIAQLPKKDSKDIFQKLEREIRQATSRESLKSWMDANKGRIGMLADDWQDVLRLQCEEMLADLRNKEAA